MSDNNVIIDSFALAGYRSFGEEIQRFESFSKINLFIGQNNCGKSNVLRFINDIYPQISSSRNAVILSSLEIYNPAEISFTFGFSTRRGNDKYNYSYGQNQNQNQDLNQELMRLKAEGDNTEKVWFDYDSTHSFLEKDWECAAKEFIRIFNKRNVNRSSCREEQAKSLISGISALEPKFKHGRLKSTMIPAIRKVGPKGSVSEDFSGEGIIERLAILQNPDVGNDGERDKFDKINVFLQTVTDNISATIEIPHNRETVLVHMDGKRLPLESLGTGIHEVIILASAATILENTVICMEEPELHLNPILQKKLVRYLDEATSNQYFITTHSAALMDTPDAEI